MNTLWRPLHIKHVGRQFTALEEDAAEAETGTSYTLTATLIPAEVEWHAPACRKPVIEGTQMAHCLGAYCPNILFPYARECITSLVSRGTFPQLNLAPVNFDALFMNYLQQQQGEEGAEPHQDA